MAAEKRDDNAKSLAAMILDEHSAMDEFLEMLNHPTDARARARSRAFCCCSRRRARLDERERRELQLFREARGRVGMGRHWRMRARVGGVRRASVRLPISKSQLTRAFARVLLLQQATRASR